MPRTLLLAALLALGACSGNSRPPLPVPSGPWARVNPDDWDWHNNDLTQPHAETGVVAGARP